MPMLAERRRKTKWMNLGRQALWNRDSGDTKFGREMMEKMGWKVGQGLGAYEQGITEPLKISFKNDNKGMGFKENDNEWTLQQCEFDELLNKLSSEKKNLPKESQNNTVQSLEEKSKLSKARVHYHKFTRGKDLTKYSKKDIECILGRNEKESSNIQGNVENIDHKVGMGDKSLITAGSMVDYFAQKMQSKKKKENDSLNVTNPGAGENLLGSNVEDELGKNEVHSTVELVEKKEKKSKKIKKKDKVDCNEEPRNEIDFNNLKSDYELKSFSEKLKKSKKTKITQAGDQSNPLDGSKDCDNVNMENGITEMPGEEGNVYETNPERDGIPGEKLKKKKKKRKKEENPVEELDVENAEVLNAMDNGEEGNVYETNPERDGIPGEKLKKKKKKRKKEENPVEEFDVENTEILNVIDNGDEEYKETEEKLKSLTSIEEGVIKEKESSKRKYAVIIDEPEDAGVLKEKIKKKKKCSEAENFFNEKDSTTDKNDLNPFSNAGTNFKKDKKEKTKTKCETAAKNKEGSENDERKENANDDSLLYKRELLDREFLFKGASRSKLFNLLCCTNIERFFGSNLDKLSGYGVVSYR